MSLSYVNAGTPADYRGSAIYIKYGKFDKFEVLEESTRYLHAICPDRELWICCHGYMEYQNPMINDYDEVVDLNLFGENCEVKQFMINHCDFLNPKTYLNKKKGKGSLIFCDSGGFQIATGRVTVVNPINLVKFYNKNADLGMILDIPDYNEGGCFSDEIVQDLADIQKRNTDYMLKYKDDSVELINVIHGGTPEQKFNYLKAVHSDKIHKLAIPSVGIGMDIKRLNFILELLKLAKSLGTYNHFHLLGTFNKGLLLTMAKFANCKIPEIEGVNFTTDSSAALMNSSNLSYYKNISIWEGLDKFSPNKNERIIQIDLGRKSFENNFNKFNEFCELPCQCPVCRAIKYTYVFRYLNGGILRNSLFYYHNCLETEKYVNMLDRFAKNLTWKEYTEMVKRLQDTDDSDTLLNLKFLHDVEKLGLEKAQEKYKHYLDEKPKANLKSLLAAKTNQRDQDLLDNIHNLIDQYKNIDFENYNEDVKVSNSKFNVRIKRERV